MIMIVPGYNDSGKIDKLHLSDLLKQILLQFLFFFLLLEMNSNFNSLFHMGSVAPQYVLQSIWYWLRNTVRLPLDMDWHVLPIGGVNSPERGEGEECWNHKI